MPETTKTNHSGHGQTPKTSDECVMYETRRPVQIYVDGIAVKLISNAVIADYGDIHTVSGFAIADDNTIVTVTKSMSAAEGAAMRKQGKSRRIKKIPKRMLEQMARGWKRIRKGGRRG